MTNIVNGKWVGAKQNRWPIGRGVAIYIRPEKARRHLEAGARLGRRVGAARAVVRRVLHDLFAPLDIGKPANAESEAPDRIQPRQDKAA